MKEQIRHESQWPGVDYPGIPSDDLAGQWKIRADTLVDRGYYCYKAKCSRISQTEPEELLVIYLAGGGNTWEAGKAF